MDTPMNKYFNGGAEFEAKQEPVRMVKLVSVAESPYFNINKMMQSIDTIDTMSNQEVSNFVSRNYKKILSAAFSSEADSAKYISKLQDTRVLDAFIELFSNNRPEQLTMVQINTICYHYITLPKERQDQDVLYRMMHLSSVINSRLMHILIGYGLPQNLASMILIARFSDMNINICVRRVNFIIITSSKELMTEDMIEKIFRVLYDCMNNFPRIYSSFMLDVIPEYNEEDENTFWITEDVQDIDSYIGLVVLNILDSLPSQMIRNTLVQYSEGMNTIYSAKPTRFSLRTLSNDYYRINSVISQIEANEGVYLP